MAERFNQRVNIQPVSSDTGAAQEQMHLADRLEQFKTMSYNLAEANAIKRGELKAGQVELTKEDKITQTPKYKREGLFGRVEALSHNKSLRAAYLASIDTDIKTNIADIQAKNHDDIIKFNEAAQGFRKGMINSVDPTARQAVTTALDERIGLTQIKVQNATIKKQKEAARAELQISLESAAVDATRAAAAGDNDLADKELAKTRVIISEMVAADFIDADKGVEYLKGIDREVTEQGLRAELDVISDVSIEDANKKIDELEDKVPEGWTPDDWKVFIKSARQDVKYKKSVLKAEDAARSDATEDLWFAKTLDGTITDTDIKTGYVDDPAKREAAFKFKQSQSDRSLTAKRAEETIRIRDKNQLFTEEQRATSKVESDSEKKIDSMYHNNKLSKDDLENSDAKTEIKRAYRSLLKQRDALAKEDLKDLNKQIAKAEIVMKLGTWTDPQLKAYLNRGLDGSEIVYWMNQNKEVQEDAKSFRHDTVFKQGLLDLNNGKKNNIFIGGGTPTDLAEDNVNTQRYLDAVEQYQEMAAKEDADFAKILNNIKAPYITEATKWWITKKWQSFTGKGGLEDTLNSDLTNKSDEEILNSL